MPLPNVEDKRQNFKNGFPIRPLFNQIFKFTYGKNYLGINERSVFNKKKGDTLTYEIQQSVLYIARRWHDEYGYKGSPEKLMFGDINKFMDSIYPIIENFKQSHLNKPSDRELVEAIELYKYKPPTTSDETKMSGPSKQSITDDEFDSQFEFEHGQRVSDSELEEAAATSEEIDMSLPLTNTAVAKKSQMRQQIKQEEMFMNEVVNTVDRSGLLALAVTSASYMAKSARPKRIGELVYDESLSTEWVACYVFEGNNALEKTVYVGLKGTESYYQMVTDGRMILRRTVKSTRYFDQTQNTFMTIYKKLDADLYLVCGHSLGGTGANQIVLDFNVENQYKKGIADVRSWTLNP